MLHSSPRRRSRTISLAIAVGLAVGMISSCDSDQSTQRSSDRPPVAGVAKADLVRDAARPATTRERFYFVMTDRFANGDPANDRGGLSGDRLVTGFDPSDNGFYHGGDLQGITDRLDYIQGLGTTAIWLTPPFVNRPVQGDPDVSAGYHGYWITDFTAIDPHLGGDDVMRALIDAAHSRGMKVYFDVVANHTADVIKYSSGDGSYISKSQQPYRTASGQEFDDAEVAGSADFPELNLESFPYTPTYTDEASRTLKKPDWLNDPTMYHNRGESTFEGESSLYGDFAGLDDLFTERPQVADGFADIYRAWVDYGVDGFRIDTVKHVNMEFWQHFSDEMGKAAKAAGKDDFFMFGEVYSSDPGIISQYTTAGRLPGALDFGFQSVALDWLKGGASTGLEQLYAQDDFYLDHDSNAYQLATFLGNHDLGRIGYLLGTDAGEELIARSQLGHSLMYLTRGQPVVQWGDEQGFVGTGGDKDARQDMFATRTDEYAQQPLIDGSQFGAEEHYGETAPLYDHIAALAGLVEQHPALADGAQITRVASPGAGIFAVSRIDATSGVEYLVVLNNDAAEASATFDTYSRDGAFSHVYGPIGEIIAQEQGRVTVKVPAQSAVVWQATGPMSAPCTADVALTQPGGGTVSTAAQLRATSDSGCFTQITFAVRQQGEETWQPLGTDDAPPFGVYHDVSHLADNTELEYIAVARFADGSTAETTSSAVVRQ